MGTINHRIEILNADKTGYDLYHVETNTNQVYDFTKSKWLSEILADLEVKVDTSELNNKLNQAVSDINAVEVIINTIETELLSKYSKPTDGISLEDLAENIKASLREVDKVAQIQQDIINAREYTDTQVASAIDTANAFTMEKTSKIDTKLNITVGTLPLLTTVDKTNLVNAINEVQANAIADVEWDDIVNKPIIHSSGSAIVTSYVANPPSFYYDNGKRTFYENISEETLGISSGNDWTTLMSIAPYYTADDDAVTQYVYCRTKTLYRYSIGTDKNTAVWGEWLELETTKGSKAKADVAEANAKNASVAKSGGTMTGALTNNVSVTTPLLEVKSKTTAKKYKIQFNETEGSLDFIFE